jgi:2,3-bisphosphoglycerate-independent phosphoglycerate mutase
MARMDRVIFIFVDGCGVGRRQEDNPFFRGRCRHITFWKGGMALADGTPITAIDATLGIAGAPQSASGQTALFCGATASALGGRHRNGYPDQHLRRVILEKNLLAQLAATGATACYLNAYPAHEKLFTAEHVRIEPDGRLWFSPSFPERFKRMISVTSCMLLASGQRPFGEKEIRAGLSLYQDYSNRQLIEKGLALPEFSPARAARVLHDASRNFAFILYEYFQTDLYAHRKTLEECVALVRDLDTLVGTLQGLLDKKRDTLVLTSDHGNLEDHRLRGHSRNPVPLIAWGRHGARLRKKIKGISDVAPAILELYSRINNRS